MASERPSAPPITLYIHGCYFFAEAASKDWIMQLKCCETMGRVPLGVPDKP
jgi:hypothetical protein